MKAVMSASLRCLIRLIRHFGAANRGTLLTALLRDWQWYCFAACGNQIPVTGLSGGAVVAYSTTRTVLPAAIFGGVTLS